MAIINKAIVEDRKQTVNRLYAVIGISLHDSEKFGHKRLKRVFEKSSKHFECVMDGYVTEEEIMQEVQKYGIFIK